jgi:predicted  nucleic acid-binding Zn-ribbon protein
MKHRCPKCGHRFDDNAQSKAAKARWKCTSKAARSAAARAAALKRWADYRAKTKPSP